LPEKLERPGYILEEKANLIPDLLNRLREKAKDGFGPTWEPGRCEFDYFRRRKPLLDFSTNSHIDLPSILPPHPRAKE